MSSPQTTTVCQGNVLNMFVLGPSLTPVAVTTITAPEQTFTVQGLKTTDVVYVTCMVAQTAGVGIMNARVSAADTLSVQFGNVTAGDLTPAAGQYAVVVHRPEGPSPLPTVIA